MKSIFITGAAAGIGLATARRFAGQGWFVGLYDVNLDGLDDAMASGDFPNACSGYCNVTSPDSVANAMQLFAARTDDQMHVLVNNAGVLNAGPFSGIDIAAHERMIDINVKGFTHVAQLGFPYLERTPGACMVNLCSASSIYGIPNLAVYSSTKFYVNGLTQALNLEWRKHDIRVTCVKPHLVDTPMAHAVTAAATQTKAVDLTPDDIAEAIDKAIHGNRVAYVVGREAKLWAFIDKLLPESLRAWFTGKLLKAD